MSIRLFSLALSVLLLCAAGGSVSAKPALHSRAAAPHPAQDAVTRARLAEMLYARFHGLLGPNVHMSPDASFIDVPHPSPKAPYYSIPVYFLVNRNILEGEPSGRFEPNTNVIRYALVMTLSRLFDALSARKQAALGLASCRTFRGGQRVRDVRISVTDVPTEHYSYGDIIKMVEQEQIMSYTNGSYKDGRFEGARWATPGEVNAALDRLAARFSQRAHP